MTGASRSARPATKAEAMRGKMLWFNQEKDLGSIATEVGGRLEVQGCDFADGVRPEGRCAGLPVMFRIGEGGQKAEQVDLVQELAPRRARLRHSSRVLAN